jgi:shikimate kinase/3-dehydroquinate synthase
MAPSVVLTGFMGSGKSSVGALAAGLLGWRFADLDEEIARTEGMPIPEFFALHGEAEFRRRELRALKAILADASGPDAPGPGLVLALGGGTLQTPEAAALLEEQGGVVYLEVDVATAWKRARGEGRPLAQDRDEFARLFTARRGTYERTADWVLPVGDLEAAELAREIAAAVGTAGTCWRTSWGLRLAGTERPSTILGGAGCLAALRAKCKEASGRGSRVYVITDENVERAWGERVRRSLGSAAGAEPLVLPAGERSKTVTGLAACWDWLAAHGTRRNDVVLALGGGVVGDLAGFAAASYLRGVGLWQVPTSLLAQVDSSVGGKTAIDLSAGKNLAGAFYQPELVVIDPNVLSTLPKSEYVNGLGEVVKYGLLVGEELFAALDSEQARIAGGDPTVLSDLIRTCVRYKAEVVSEDERDSGRRAVLNLGHTAAHALEVGLGYGALGHGQAVGLGLLVALAASEKLLGLDREVRSQTKSLLQALGLPVNVALPATEVLEAAAARDKKVVAGSAGFVGLRAVGEPVWKLDLPQGLFAEAVEVIRA